MAFGLSFFLSVNLTSQSTATVTIMLLVKGLGFKI